MNLPKELALNIASVLRTLAASGGTVPNNSQKYEGVCEGLLAKLRLKDLVELNVVVFGVSSARAKAINVTVDRLAMATGIEFEEYPYLYFPGKWEKRVAVCLKWAEYLEQCDGTI